MNWKAWKLGFVFAGLTGLLSALANVFIFDAASWKQLLASLISPTAFALLGWLKQNPIETIDDTGFRFTKSENRVLDNKPPDSTKL